MGKDKCGKCGKCDKCCKVKCKRGPTGPKGNKGDVGPTGPTGVIGCVERIVNCVNSGDKILLQHDQVDNFSCQFAPPNWVETGNAIFSKHTFSLEIDQNQEGTSTLSITTDFECGATIHFDWRTEAINEISGTFSYILDNEVTVLSTYVGNSGAESGTVSDIVVDAGQHTLSFSVVSSGDGLLAVISRLIVLFDCCNIIAAPVADVVHKKFEFSDLRTIPADLGYSGPRFFGQGNTSEAQLEDLEVSFFAVAYIVAEFSRIKHMFVAVKNLVSQSDIFIGLNTSRCNSLTGEYGPIVTEGLFLSNVPAGNHCIEVPVNMFLVSGELIAISGLQVPVVGSENSNCTLAVTLSTRDPNITLTTLTTASTASTDCNCGTKSGTKSGTRSGTKSGTKSGSTPSKSKSIKVEALNGGKSLPIKEMFKLMKLGNE